MWNGEKYDFHNECDTIHVTNELLDLHTRTKSRGGWAEVTQVALKLEDDVLEVSEDSTAMINGVALTDSFELLLDGVYPVTKNGLYTIVSLPGAQSIVFRSSVFWGVRISIDAHGSDFFGSRGMAGTWNRYGFRDRDGETLVSVASTRNAVEYGVVWEVNATLHGDPVLFSTPAEHNCIDTPSRDVDAPVPTPEEIENANKVCAGVVLDLSKKDDCVFDVLTAGVESVENNTAYTEVFEATERCVAAPTSGSSTTGLLPPTCADLGGTCVFLCDVSVNDCRPGLCIENADLTAVAGGRRRTEVVEGCSCRLPKVPSQSPSASAFPSGSPSGAPSSPPSGSPSGSPSSPPSGSSVPSESPTTGMKSSKKGNKKKDSKDDKKMKKDKKSKN